MKSTQGDQTRALAQRRIRFERFYRIAAGSLHPLSQAGLNRSLLATVRLPKVTSQSSNPSNQS